MTVSPTLMLIIGCVAFGLFVVVFIVSAIVTAKDRKFLRESAEPAKSENCYQNKN